MMIEFVWFRFGKFHRYTSFDFYVISTRRLTKKLLSELKCPMDSDQVRHSMGSEGTKSGQRRTSSKSNIQINVLISKKFYFSIHVERRF